MAKLECLGRAKGYRKPIGSALGDCSDNDASHRLGVGEVPMSGGRENDDSFSMSRQCPRDCWQSGLEMLDGELQK